jgi:copper resistance protein D
VTQFLDIFGFVSVLLRGLALAFEALTIGGAIFMLAVARGLLDDKSLAGGLRWMRASSIALAITQVVITGASLTILSGTTDLRLAELAGADFCKASLLVICGAVILAVLSKAPSSLAAALLGCASVAAGSTMLSHSAARVEFHWTLMFLTLVHHAAGAAWIGGLPYLLIALRHARGEIARKLSDRFSRLAVVSVAALAGAGAGMAYLYVGSAPAATGTTYGVMLLAKVILTSVLVLLGALNLQVVRAVRRGRSPDLLPLRRFAEAEVGIGFTVLLAAASLTSTPPAIDVVADRVTGQEIVRRMTPRWPRMETPALAELSPANALVVPENTWLPGSFVPGQARQVSKPADIAWSEYNHHWAGLVVLMAGVLAAFSRKFGWARHWPLAFLGLAVFLLIRADSENWPLGPRGFWESFRVAEVAQHRFFVLLIVAFVIFEWAVQTGRLARHRAGLVFPLVCAVGGSLLMTHSHSLGNVKEELLAELTHIPLAIFAVVAGWSRWLEIRLPSARAGVVAWIWPICFALMGTVLMLYRET